MNTVVTSREEILKTAKALALSGSPDALNIRGIARSCGISVGTVYNYFPAKNDLIIAVISEIWKEIFYVPQIAVPVPDRLPPRAFLDLLKQLYGNIGKHRRLCNGFLPVHAAAVTDKDSGRFVMESGFTHITEILRDTLAADSAIRKEIWNSQFTPQVMADFIFDFLKTDLIRGQDRSNLLMTLLTRSLYEMQDE